MNKAFSKFIAVLILCSGHVNISSQKLLPGSDTLFKSVKWRNIGPLRGGRSVAACGVDKDPMTYYMGTTGGGLWKTSDMGISWENISDGYFTTGTIGAVAVAKSNENIVYVGSGEHAIRGVMTHSGDGVYKSVDGGKSWKKTGLELSQHISRIIIHPTNPDIAYVAVQGALYSKSEQRGIYKTMDGGKTWQKSLYVNEMTGCVELSMDAKNPDIIYAAMWEHGRKPWKVISGGPGSSLYKSIDAGLSWQKINDGLPKELGKMAIAVCPSNSEKVYALIESDSKKELGGLFVSSNSGASWSRVSGDHRLIQRAWYYIELFIDPQNENVVYVLSASAYKSADGGNSWNDYAGSTHGDYHDLWINPHNPKNMVIADDGGAAITFNGGSSWSHQNYATAQFYRVNTDNLFPYNIYGGQQDNSSVKIAHRSFGGSIGNESWTYSAGGESAFVAFNPDDPSLVMGGSYQGTIELLHTKAKNGTSIMAAPIQYLSMNAADMKYRYNWNAPIICSKHDPKVFYHGSQILLKTNDYGKSWTEVSGDLTRNDKTKQGTPGEPYTNEAVGAENYGTLAYIAESPHEAGVIYTGSDDGYVQLTKDGGKTWTNITPTGLQECLINAIEVSPHDKATVYIATTRYKFNDHKPGLYKSMDYGKTWKKIDTGIPNHAFTRVIREDDVKKDLLFAGTENGLYISWNGGLNWQAMQLNLPMCPITDLKIHNGDLIAATSGRSYWVLDDLSVFRQTQGADNKFMMYQPEDNYIASGSSPLNQTNDNFTGMSSSGVNAANGIVLYYNIPAIKPDKPLKLTIKNKDNKVIRTITSVKDSTFKEWDGGPKTLTVKKGLNRFVWDMRYSPMAGIPNVYYEASFRGHKAIPGRYEFVLEYDTETSSTTASILPNPLYPSTNADYEAYDEFMLDMENNVNDMHKMVNDLYAKNEKLSQFLNTIKSEEKHKELYKNGQMLSDKIKAFDNDMVQRLSKAYDDVENHLNKFTSNYMYVLNQCESEIPVITKGALEERAKQNSIWQKMKVRGEELINKDLPAYNQQICASGIGTI